jgi:hypothetical protein
LTALYGEKMKDIILKVNADLSIIVALENQLFSGGIFSIFKKKNFSVISTALRSQAQRLAVYQENLLRMTHSSTDEALEISFVEYLQNSTLKMAEISDKLSKKADNSISYKINEYKNDVNELRLIQDAYVEIGGILNEKYKKL